jgi:Tol biopolymer transport system component
VAFESDATNLGPADTNGKGDVYVRDLQMGITTLASVNKDGTDAGNAVSYLPAISANGKFVAFQGLASDLGPVDTNGTFDVYVRDLQTNTTTLVSVNSIGSDSGNGGSLQPSISADGRYVAFWSDATDLGPIDTNGMRDVYVRDLQLGITTLVSANSTGIDGGNGGSFKPSISDDGRYVAFRSDADDLGPVDTNGTSDVYVRDLLTGILTLVSVNETGDDSGNGQSYQPIISSNGNYVAFSSIASDLEDIDTDSAADIFLYSLVADSDGDGIPDDNDDCPDEDSSGFDVDGNGCIDSMVELSEMLETLVMEGVIAEELQNSLLSKIENAEKSADKENVCAAINKLEALINEVNAQRGKKISDEAADDVIVYANSVISWLLNQLAPGETC